MNHHFYGIQENGRLHMAKFGKDDRPPQDHGKNRQIASSNRQSDQQKARRKPRFFTFSLEALLLVHHLMQRFFGNILFDLAMARRVR